MQRTRSHLNYERLSPHQHHYFKLSLDFVPWRAGIVLKLGQSTILKLGIGWVVSGLSKISRERNNWKVEERTQCQGRWQMRNCMWGTFYNRPVLGKITYGSWGYGNWFHAYPLEIFYACLKQHISQPADISRCISICTNSILSNNYMRYAFYSCFIPDKVK